MYSSICLSVFFLQILLPLCDSINLVLKFFIKKSSTFIIVIVSTFCIFNEIKMIKNCISTAQLFYFLFKGKYKVQIPT